jgi:alkyldihydroxyacetonephosphate synthase
MNDLVKNRVCPASVRLMDSLQFRFAIAFSGTPTTFKKKLMSKIKTFFLTKVKGYDPHKLAVATLLFEGNKDEVELQTRKVFEISKKYNGLQAGEESGHKGYNLTFLIAYIRDFVMEHNFIAESLETSVPWKNILPLCENTRKSIYESAKKYGVDREPFVTFRITLLYETGATIYIYFGFSIGGLKDPLAVYEKIEEEARWAILKSGGSLSHHHGVGKLRKKFMPIVMKSCGLDMIKALKEKIDPSNIFASINIIDTPTQVKTKLYQPLFIY